MDEQENLQPPIPLLIDPSLQDNPTCEDYLKNISFNQFVQAKNVEILVEALQKISNQLYKIFGE